MHAVMVVTGHGLRIRSEVALPGAVPSDAPGEIDLDITLGAESAWEARRSAGPYHVASADLFDFVMPELARFTCIDRRRIVVDPVAGADPDFLSDMLIATVIPAQLWARGEIVLHAAAFAMPGAVRAIAVAGASGSGKSTALVQALAIGAWAIGDDSCRLDPGPDGVRINGMAGGYFARGNDGTRHFRSVPSVRIDGADRLGAIVALTPDIATPRRLTGVDAPAMLLRHRHRPPITSLLGTEPILLATMTTIVSSVPIIAWPCRPTFADGAPR